MISFSYGSSSGSVVPPGANLWQKIGTGGDPNDIELTPAIGTTGINAANPADTNMRLVLNNSFGEAYAAWLAEDSVNDYVIFNGITPPSSPNPTYSPSLLVQKLSTGELVQIFIGETQAGNLGATIEHNVSGVSNQLYVDVGGTTAFNSSAGILFRITAAGHIETNQVVTASLKTPNGKYFPVYNAAGVLQGYVPLST